MVFIPNTARLQRANKGVTKMQANKIKVNGTYAVKNENGVLARLNVTAVVTRRVNNYNNPHDYESHVEGYITESHIPGENPSIVKVSTEKVLGPYEEYAELVQRREAEKAEQNRKQEHIKERALLLRRLFYELIDKPLPNDDNEHRQLFRLEYGNSVDVSKEAVEPLIAALMHIVATKRNAELTPPPPGERFSVS
jgi:hypothetical protein